MSNTIVNYKIIGLRVSMYRYQREWTQEELAERAGVSKQFICNIECGRTIPSLKTVLSLCHALNVNTHDLLHHCSTYDPDAPCTLRDDTNVFEQTITDQLFPQEPHEIRIDPQDLPEFDITLPDPSEEQ
ncbi:MAG: helix-turn-helix transcriptional regulator [Clostridia bacterium]|nr:helix-turn-helix transcriptional regulator [Clostridia bacterium]